MSAVKTETIASAYFQWTLSRRGLTYPNNICRCIFKSPMCFFSVLFFVTLGRILFSCCLGWMISLSDCISFHQLQYIPHDTLNRPFALIGFSPEFKGTFVCGASIGNHPRSSLVWFQRRAMHHYLLQQVLPGSWVPVAEQWTLTELSSLGLWDKRVHEHRHRGCRSWKTLYWWTNWSGREQYNGRAILAQTSWWMRRYNMQPNLHQNASF